MQEPRERRSSCTIKNGFVVKQGALALGLILLPVGLFSVVEVWLMPPRATASAMVSMDDLAPLIGIVTDVQGLVAKGDLAAAGGRIADLETAWDDDKAQMRPLNPAVWRGLDDLIDAALHALRAGAPDAPTVTVTLDALLAGLRNPGGVAGTGGVQMEDGIAVTDATGHPLPCEDMINAMRAQSQDGLSAADKTSLTDCKPGRPSGAMRMTTSMLTHFLRVPWRC